MDPGSSSLRSSSTRVSRNHDREKEDKPKGQSKGTKYKEKFQSMREKFDQATAMNDQYRQDLEVANAKIKRLHAENNLLLDAMNIADNTLIERFLPPSEHSRPEDLDYMSVDEPLMPHTARDVRIMEAAERNGHHRSNSAHMNGNGNGYSNGTRHRPVEEGPPTDYTLRSANGRLP
ncbi:hypothetical protein BDQ12DRAFT_721885 [Crucibulum laeve]|uniref:Uncharacterized protein n=1 Tax=Crucibulum laeve TaxID=68775 RepID=A0A5C3M4L1_9AGAR|nr:hypothetical protein BDQ12DRAFT_721885 [Crucibulum laeve]